MVSIIGGEAEVEGTTGDTGLTEFSY